MNVAEFLAKHSFLGGSADWTLISTKDEASRRELASRGITLIGTDAARENYFLLASSHTYITNFSVNFGSGTGNVVCFGDVSRLSGRVNINGNQNIFICEGAPNRAGITYTDMEAHGSGNTLIIRKGTSSSGLKVVLQDGVKVTLGEDGMFGEGVIIRATDNHAIIDLEDRRVLNSPADVVIDPHVWVGTRALIMKGVHVGRGSVVGAMSLVNRDIPARALAAGVPAKVLRENISWTRSLVPSDVDIDAALAYSE